MSSRRRLGRSMSMNDASKPGGGPRSSGSTQEFKALRKTPVYPRAEAVKPIGAVPAGTVVLALDTKMDKKGRSFVYHGGGGGSAPGWSPSHADDNSVLLQPVPTADPGRASVGGGASPTVRPQVQPPPGVEVGENMRVKLQAPYFRLHERDNTVLGMLKIGETIVVLETRLDGAGRLKVRHAGGWTPTRSPDGVAVLEPLPATTGPVVDVAEDEEEEEEVEEGTPNGPPPPSLAELEPSGPPPTAAPQPAATQPAPQPQAAATASEADNAASRQMSDDSPRERPSPRRAQSMAAGAMDAAQEAAPAYVPRGRRGRGGGLAGRLASQQTHQSAPPQQQQPQQPRSDGNQSVRLLYVSRESGFGMQFGVTAQGVPTVDGFLGDSARSAGVIPGSVIVSVGGVGVGTIQQLAQLLAQKEQAARDGGEASLDATVEFILGPAPPLAPAAPVAGQDLLSLISAPQKRWAAVRSSLGNTSDVVEEDGDPRAREMGRLSEQISAVGLAAEKLMRDLPELRAALSAAKTADEKEHLEEEISDNQSALKQQDITQTTLLNKLLKLIDEHSETLSKQRNFEVDEAKKYVTFQSKFLVDKENEILSKRNAVAKSIGEVGDKVNTQEEKKVALSLQHSESTAPIRAEMELHLGQVSELDKDIATLISTLKKKQKLRDETMDKADELNGSITAQLKLFAGPALEEIEAEKRRLGQAKIELERAQGVVDSEVDAMGATRTAAVATRSQRAGKITTATTEIHRVHEVGGRCALALERLRGDRGARAKAVDSSSTVAKDTLATATAALNALRSSEAGEAARIYGGLGVLIPHMESDIEALKAKLDQLAVDKVAFAKAKNFKGAGQAKKDIDSAEVELASKEELMSKHKVSEGSASANDAAATYNTKLAVAEKTAAEANAAYGAGLVKGECDWLAVLQGRKAAAVKADELALSKYIGGQIFLAESEAKAVAAAYAIDPAIVSAETLSAVAVDATGALAQKASYGTIVELALEELPVSPLAVTDFGESSGSDSGSGSEGGDEAAGGGGATGI